MSRHQQKAETRTAHQRRTIINVGHDVTSLYRPKERTVFCSCPNCVLSGEARKRPEEVRAELAGRYAKEDWRIEGFGWFLTQILNTELPAELKLSDTLLWDKGMPKSLFKISGNKLIRCGREPMSKEYARKHFAVESRQPTVVASLLAGDAWKRLALFKTADGKAPSAVPSFGRQETPLIQKLPHKAVLKMRSGMDYEEEGDENVHPQPTVYLTEKLLGEIFAQWPYEKMKGIVLMQTIARLRGNRAHTIRIHYFSNPAYSKENEPDVKFGELGELGDRIRKCQEICGRLCHRVVTHTDYEVLEMLAEFYTTDDEIWLVDVWRVVYWNINEERNKKSKEAAQESLLARAAVKKVLMTRIKLREDVIKTKADRASHVQGLAKIMDNLIEDIKYHTGTTDYLAAPEFMNSASDDAYARLRPKSRLTLAQTLSQLSLPRFSVHKCILSSHTNYSQMLRRRMQMWPEQRATSVPGSDEGADAGDGTEFPGTGRARRNATVPTADLRRARAGPALPLRRDPAGPHAHSCPSVHQSDRGL